MELGTHPHNYKFLTIYLADVESKIIGTFSKLSGNRENKPQSVTSEETGLLDSKRGRAYV